MHKGSQLRKSGYYYYCLFLYSYLMHAWLLNYTILMCFWVQDIQVHHILSDNFRFKRENIWSFEFYAMLYFFVCYRRVASWILRKRDTTCAAGRDCLPCSLISTTTAYSNITRFERQLVWHFCSCVVHYNFSCNLHSCFLE